jgi:hypothetical protein
MRLKKGENVNADRWHTGPAWETVLSSLSFSVLCADLYSENFYLLTI